MSAEHPAYALVGRIARAHGIRGELLVEPVTDQPGAFFAPGCRVYAGDGEGDPLAAPAVPGAVGDPSAPPMTLTITGARPHQGALLLTVDLVRDRTVAEQWRGRTLLVPINEIHEPVDGEVFLHELVGMTAVDEAHAPLGTVSAWYEVPQGILLGLTHDGRETLVPFVDDIVIALDRGTRVMTLRLPEGLGA